MALDETTAAVAKDPLKTLRFLSVNPPAEKQELLNKRAVTLDERSLRFFSDSQKIQQNLQGLSQRFQSAAVTLPIAWVKFTKGSPINGDELVFDVEYADRKDNPRDYTDVSQDFEDRVESADRLHGLRTR